MKRSRSLNPGAARPSTMPSTLLAGRKCARAGPPEDVRRILIVLSDGLDVQSQHTLDQAVSMARMAETMIYTVGTAAYGFSNPGDKLLDDISVRNRWLPLFPLARCPGHRPGDGLPFPWTDRGYFPKQRFRGGNGRRFPRSDWCTWRTRCKPSAAIWTNNTRLVISRCGAPSTELTGPLKL